MFSGQQQLTAGRIIQLLLNYNQENSFLKNVRIWS